MNPISDDESVEENGNIRSENILLGKEECDLSNINSSSMVTSQNSSAHQLQATSTSSIQNIGAGNMNTSISGFSASTGAPPNNQNNLRYPSTLTAGVMHNNVDMIAVGQHPTTGVLNNPYNNIHNGHGFQASANTVFSRKVTVWESDPLLDDDTPYGIQPSSTIGQEISESNTMDSSNDALLQEMIERQQMQRDGVDAYIEGVSQELLRNDSWETFRPDEIAEASLQGAVKKNDSSAGDEQTRRFRQFLSIATNFSSLPFAEKLHKIPELVESIKKLLENMMKEVQEYSDMANELRDLIQCFVRMVMQAKHNVNMMLPLLTAAKSQMTIVQDVMNTDPTQALNEIDKRDIKLALNRMSSGIQNLLSLAKSSMAESQKLDDRIHNMTNSVQSKKVIVEERLDIANFCFKCSVPVGTIASGGAVGGLVAAESFGGIGALVIAGTAFPPVIAIIGACILGGVCAGTAIILVKKFWARRQLKALNYLNQIFKGLVELNSANMNFMRYMADTEEKANTVSQHIEDIQLCLESERQRRANRDVCAKAIDSTTTMIESLIQISSLDISKWTDTSNTISFSRTKGITNAITN